MASRCALSHWFSSNRVRGIFFFIFFFFIVVAVVSIKRELGDGILAWPYVNYRSGGWLSAARNTEALTSGAAPSNLERSSSSGRNVASWYKMLDSAVMCLSVACEKAAGRCRMAAGPADLTVIEEVITIERASCLFISQFYRVAFLLLFIY